MNADQAALELMVSQCRYTAPKLLVFQSIQHPFYFFFLISALFSLSNHLERNSCFVHPETMPYTWTFICLSLLLFLVWRGSKIGRRLPGYPPGPPTLPLIGNLHQIPKKDGYLQFQKWAEEYG